MLDLSAKDLLGLTVLGAIITTFGTLVGLVLKEFVAVRFFEQWKARIAADEVFRRYRDPLSLASFELINRLIEVIEKEHPNFLKPEILKIESSRSAGNSNEDPYFQKYKYDSTVFRLANVLAWIELFRQEVTFLDSGHSQTNSAISECLRKLRGALADGHLSENLPDWKEWRDYLIFREEQRAVGESLINKEADPRRIEGYGYFLSDYAKQNSRWHICIAGFFEDLGQQEKDYRVVRCKLLVLALGELLILTNSQLITSRIREAVSRYSQTEVSWQHSNFPARSRLHRLGQFANRLSS